MTAHESKNRPLTDEEKQALGDGAALIREHLWLGVIPPPPPHPHDRPWTMARDLSIWKRLLFCGRRPDEINGAIRFARKVLTNHAGHPLRLTIFFNSQGYATPLFEQAVGLYYKSQEQVTFGRAKLPPRVADVLRSMIAADD